MSTPKLIRDVQARTLEVQKVIESSSLPKDAETALAILQFGVAIAKATEVDKHVVLLKTTGAAQEGSWRRTAAPK